MMKLITLYISLILNAYAGSGSDVGNGGDTIYCTKSNLNEFRGHYTLDYLLEYNSDNSINQSLSFDEYKSKIKKNLQRVYPEILPQFNDFFKALKVSHTHNRKWIPSEANLFDLKDENIIKRIPKNCLKNGKLTLSQTVIRKVNDQNITYHFDDGILRYQKRNNPLQYSFFMIHEWLWDTTRDVRILRKMNWILHSKEFETMQRKDLITKFNGWKIFQPKLSYCHRSSYVMSYYSDSCKNTNARNLRSVKELKFNKLPSDFLFRIGAFYGFGSVAKLDISNHKDIQSLLNPRIFSPLFRLEELILTNGHIKKLSSQVTRDLKKVSILNLIGNPELIIDNAFLFLVNLETLKISNSTQIKVLPPSLKRIFINGTPPKELIESIIEINPKIHILNDL